MHLSNSQLPSSFFPTQSAIRKILLSLCVQGEGGGHCIHLQAMVKLTTQPLKLHAVSMFQCDLLKLGCSACSMLIVNWIVQNPFLIVYCW